MSIQTVEISLPESIIKVIEIRQGPAGSGGGTNSVTSATTSDGTAALYLDSIRFEATNGGPTQLGEMAWESSDGSIDAMLESGVIVAMGEDLVLRVRNTTASPITKGTALAYDGTSGASGRIKVKPWVGANISTAKLFLGFAACDIPANSNGYSQWFGKLAGINTSGGAQTWLDEQIIYAVPGASATITNVAPTSGEYAAAAVVINAGSGTSGILLVRPTFEVASSTSATANTLALRDEVGGITAFQFLTSEGAGFNAGGLTFPGTGFSGTLTIGENTADRSATLPNATGNLILDSTLSATLSANASTYRIALGAGTTGAELFGAATATAANQILGMVSGTAKGTTAATGVTENVISLTIPSAGFWRIEALSTFLNASSSSTLMSLLFDSEAVVPANTFRIGQVQVNVAITALAIATPSLVATFGVTSSAVTHVQSTAFGLIETTGASTLILRVSNTAGSGTSTVTQASLSATKL